MQVTPKLILVFEYRDREISFDFEAAFGPTKKWME